LLLLTRKLKGRLTAAATIEGPAAARAITGNVEVRNGAIDQLTYQRLSGKGDYANQVARIEATLTEKPGAELTATGTVPVADENSEVPGDDRLALRIKSSAVGLQVVQALTDQVTDLAGTLELNLEVGGTLQTPRVYGELAVRDGALRIVETGARYQKLDTQLVFEGPTARIDRLRVEDSAGHPLTASVRVGLEGRSINAFEMQARAADFKVLNNRLGEVSIDGNLTLQGGLDSPQVEGNLKIASGTLEIDRILERLTSNPYQTKPTRVDDSEAAPASPSPLTNAQFHLTLEVPGNLVLRGTDIKSGAGPALGDMNVTVGGTLELQKEKGDQARLIGSVTTVRGIYNFQGRRFSVRRDGRIEFRGGEPVDPSLDLAADREVSGVVAHVEIGGTSRKPTLKLSSDPPMEETDILSLIVFNQPANQLGEGERINLSERAAALAGGVVVGAITESLGRALNLSIFEVETVAEAGGAPMLTVGKQVGSKLFVRLRQIFGAQEVSELQLEYQLTDYLRAQGSVSDGRGLANRSFTRRIERGGLDLVVFVRY
jgi:translocation and assembly module TamB